MWKTIMRCVLFVWIISVVIVFLIILSNPLRKSQEKITKKILELTPIGMSMEEVVNVIESNKNWEWSGYISSGGFLKQPSPPESRTVVGEQSIRVCIGEYRNIFTTSVTVFWGFDENAKLIDVWVWKDKDMF